MTRHACYLKHAFLESASHQKKSVHRKNASISYMESLVFAVFSNIAARSKTNENGPKDHFGVIAKRKWPLGTFEDTESPFWVGRVLSVSVQIRTLIKALDLRHMRLWCMDLCHESVMCVDVQCGKTRCSAKHF